MAGLVTALLAGVSGGVGSYMKGKCFSRGAAFFLGVVLGEALLAWIAGSEIRR